MEPIIEKNSTHQQRKGEVRDLASSLTAVAKFYPGKGCMPTTWESH